MSTFFVTRDAVSDDKITIVGEDAHHISKVLRMSVGDGLRVSDMACNIYLCRIESFAADRVELAIEEITSVDTEPPYTATLLMALPKQDKMELIVQKAVEMGCTRIIPFQSSRCICKLDRQGGEKKRERWQKIAKSAAEQCGRAIIPEVSAPVSFKEAVEILKNAEHGFMCYEGENALSIKEYLMSTKPGDFVFMIGAEGGFSLEEYGAVKSLDIPSVTFGKRILRCETAPIFVLSCLSIMYES